MQPKKTAYYLIIMDDEKRLDIKKLGELLNEKGMKFCSPEDLKDKMSLYPGVVSLFGLINNTEHDINICLDNDMLSEKTITFHPNDNTKTLFLSMGDMFKFITELGYEHSIINL